MTTSDPIKLRSAAGVALITTTILASAVGTLDAGVVTVAVPAIRRGLHASVPSVQWTLTGYLLTVAALLLLSGSLTDHFGRRRVLATGLIVMLVASIGCTVAPSIGWLIAARIVQGVGGALVAPSSLALLNGTLRPGDRARGIGLWAGLETLASTVGPYVGGWLVDNVSWRAVFLLNVPLILACLVVLWFVPETQLTRRRLSLDGLGAFAAVVGLGGVVYALTAASTSGWVSAPVITAGAIGVVALIALIAVEPRIKNPMLRLSLFRSRQFSSINAATLLFYGALSAVSYVVFLEFELRLGYSAAQAGAALIPESVVFLLVAPVSGILVAHFGPRRLMVVGMVMVAGALIWLSRLQPGSGYVAAVLPGVLLWGLGIGVMVTPLTAAVLAAVSDEDLGEASAINDAAARLGGVIVVALVPVLIGAVGGRTLGHALVRGYSTAMIVMAALCVAAAVISGLFVSDSRASSVRAAGQRRETVKVKV
jgi:EmrB/QacA subfamily drug resistance transporter